MRAGHQTRPGEKTGLSLSMSDNTQIYVGTNQIQRMVMARQLLKG